MAAVSHARFHPPAPPTAIAPPTAVWEANDSKSKSVSPAFMRPLYASCRDHYRAHHRQQFRWQQPQQAQQLQRQAQPSPPSPQACEHHHQRHHHNDHHHNRDEQHTTIVPSAASPSTPSKSSALSSSASPPPTRPVHQFLVLNELPRMPSSSHSTFSATTAALTAPTTAITDPAVTGPAVTVSPLPTSSATSTSQVQQPAGQPSSPFLRLPVEIRLQIYALLVLPSRDSDLTPSYERVASSTQDYYDYEKPQKFSSSSSSAAARRPTLLIRTIDPERYHERHPPSRPHARSIYSVRASRFRSRCMQTTYHCVNVPRIEHKLGILRANKQIHAEAAELLYSSYTFDFDTHVEAVVPFLADLSPLARSSIRALRLVKRALAYDRDFDRAEWSNALRYLTSATADLRCLRRLELGVVAGRPGPAGWDRVAAYSAADFSRVRSMEGMEWLQYLLEFVGLRELDVRAVVEHCPPVTSSSVMASYVRFSASVEAGFADFLRAQLLGPAAAGAAVA